jgi:hypothetical protein
MDPDELEWHLSTLGVGRIEAPDQKARVKTQSDY